MFEFLNTLNPFSADFSAMYFAIFIVILLVIVYYMGSSESFGDRKYGVFDLGVSTKDVHAAKLAEIKQLDGK